MICRKSVFVANLTFREKDELQALNVNTQNFIGGFLFFCSCLHPPTLHFIINLFIGHALTLKFFPNQLLQIALFKILRSRVDGVFFVAKKEILPSLF